MIGLQKKSKFNHPFQKKFIPYLKYKRNCVEVCYTFLRLEYSCLLVGG